MENKIVLIDGHSILNRAFYGIPELTNSEGIHTNAVYGFLNILFRILEEEKPEYLAVAFDVHHPTFRHEMYEAYKGTRKPMPEELREQVPLMKEVLTAMGVTILEKPGYEADDILGTIAKMGEREGVAVSVVSGDRDLLQLAGEHVCIRIPKTKKGTTTIEDYFAKDVIEAMGVTPQEFIDVKALMGDTSDNIPGVPGVGEKTALSIIRDYHSIENAYAHLEEIKPNRAKKALSENFEQAKMSKILATIDTSCPLEFSFEQAKLENLFTKEAFFYMKRLEFKSILAKFDAENQVSQKAEASFVLIEDFAEAEKVFAEAKNADVIGFQLLTDKNGIFGLSLSYLHQAEEVSAVILAGGFLTSGYLSEKSTELCGQVKTVAVLDLKAMLPFVKIEREENIVDTGVAGYLLNPLKSTYDYDDLARDYLGMTIASKTELLGKMNFVQAREEKPEAFLSASCFMSYIPYKAADVLLNELEKQGMKHLFEEIEMPLLYSLHRMEQTGIKAKKDELKDYGNKLQVRIEELEKKIYELAGERFNINSPKQLGIVLFENLKLPFGKKTKTGYSTSADILEKLRDEHPVIALILEYRQLTKLKSTYADGLAAFIGKDGRIHGRFNQTITATGRISSTEPNLQNIPVRMELGREIRRVFVPKEGCVLVDADYSQIELRVLAHMSGDERLIEAYRHAQDIHRITASQVFHVPLEDVTSMQRRNAKAVNFGIVYGISAFGLSEDLSITRKEALEYINQYFETYPEVKKFLDRQVEQAREKGYVTTLFGRRRPVPEIKSSNFMQRSFGERIAMNSPIQGTAADIIKIAMIRTEAKLKEEGLMAKIILQVHDELLVETPADEVEKVKQVLKEEMSKAADLRVPLEVDIHAGGSWFETK